MCSKLLLFSSKESDTSSPDIAVLEKSAKENDGWTKGPIFLRSLELCQMNHTFVS
jgi:hypothetical protein